jgi:hypothetical protein
VGKASLYGFHGTLAAPFRTGRPEKEIAGRLEELAAGASAFELPRLRVAVLRGAFTALVPEYEPPPLRDLEARLVTSLRPLALDPDPLDAARRGTLTEGQARNQSLWGYPYVLSEFSFHLTLANSADGRLVAALQGYFPQQALGPLPFAAVSLCLQREGGAPFRVIGDFPLRGARDCGMPRPGDGPDMSEGPPGGAV